MIMHGNSISPLAIQLPLSIPFLFPSTLPTIYWGFHGRVSKENMEISQPHLINLFIISQRTDATEIVKGQWLLRSFYAFFSSASLPWEVLPTVLTTVIVPSVSPVVQIKSVERDVTTVRTTTSVERTSNAVIGNVSAVSLHVRVRTTISVALMRIVVEEFAPHTVVGAAGLLQAL